MISDRAWVEGMAQLVACCSSADLTPEMAHVRGRCYREDLQDLTDDGWLRAVKRARQGKWFPAIDELREFAKEAVEVAGFLPPARRTDEEAEADRQAAKRGLELCRAAAGVDRDPVKPMPDAAAQAQPKDTEVEATEDRLALLRAQAEQIQAAPAAIGG